MRKHGEERKKHWKETGCISSNANFAHTLQLLSIPSIPLQVERAAKHDIDKKTVFQSVDLGPDGAT